MLALWVVHFFVLVTLLLFVLLRTKSAESESTPGGAIARSLLIGAGTLAMECTLFHRSGLLVVIPVLVLTVAVLSGTAWTVMRNALLVALLSTVAAAGTVSYLRRDRAPSPTVLESLTKLAKGKDNDVARYQQVAENLNFADTKPSPGKPGQNAKPGPSPATPPKPATPAATQTWAEARAQLAIGGSMVLADSRRVAVINHRMVELSNVVTLVHGGSTYRWRVIGISGTGVSLEPLDARATAQREEHAAPQRP
jgi:hypothetical protein